MTKMMKRHNIQYNSAEENEGIEPTNIMKKYALFIQVQLKKNAIRQH